jgi:hypothetical protein
MGRQLFLSVSDMFDRVLTTLLCLLFLFFFSHPPRDWCQQLSQTAVGFPHRAFPKGRKNWTLDRACHDGKTFAR